METTISADGTDVRGYDEGRGPAILIIGPGYDDGTRARKLAAILAERFRVLRLHRRQYRLDLRTEHSAPFSVAEEVDDVLAVARHVGQPLVVYGHSSGGVVALEALVAAPASFAGAVIYEPACVVETPWGGAGGEILAKAQAAITAGKPGTAMAIFTRDVTGYPAWQARLAGAFAALIPRYRRLAPCQLHDLGAMDQLGNRLGAYARIAVPTMLVNGDRSPARNTAVLDAVERAMPDAERVVMHNRDHNADLRAPNQLADVIGTFADRTLLNRS